MPQSPNGMISFILVPGYAPKVCFNFHTHVVIGCGHNRKSFLVPKNIHSYLSCKDIHTLLSEHVFCFSDFQVDLYMSVVIQHEIHSRIGTSNAGGHDMATPVNFLDAA